MLNILLCSVLILVASIAWGLATTAPVPPSPRAIARAFVRAIASGDMAGASDLLHADTSSQLELYMQRPVAEMLAGRYRYARAMRETFGESARDVFGISPEMDEKAIEEAVEQIHGDRATLAINGSWGRSRMVLMRVEGGWRIPLWAVYEPMPDDPGNEDAIRRHGAMAEIYQHLAAEVLAGEFATAEAAAKEACSRIREAARGGGMD